MDILQQSTKRCPSRYGCRRGGRRSDRECPGSSSPTQNKSRIQRDPRRESAHRDRSLIAELLLGLGLLIVVQTRVGFSPELAARFPDLVFLTKPCVAERVVTELAALIGDHQCHNADHRRRRCSIGRRPSFIHFLHPPLPFAVVHLQFCRVAERNQYYRTLRHCGACRLLRQTDLGKR
jgi:hypothetical protein